MVKVNFNMKQWKPTVDAPPAEVETREDNTENRDQAQGQNEVQSQEGDGHAQPSVKSYTEQYLEQNSKPVKSDYHEGADWLKTLTPPMTAEEEEKRKKAATAVEAVGHIGNIITGLSNLLYTQHGVQPVTLAKVPSAGLDTFGDKIRAMREKYEAQRQKAILMDRSAYDDALKVWNAGYRDALELDLKADEARRKAKADADNLELNKKALEIRREALDETKRRDKENERIRIQTAETGGSKKTVRVLNAKGGYDTYRTEDLKNESNIGFVYQRLPDEYKVRDENDFVNATRDGDGKIVFPFKKKVTKSEMLNAIASATADGELDTFSDPLKLGTGGGSKKSIPASVSGKKKNPI